MKKRTLKYFVYDGNLDIIIALRPAKIKIMSSLEKSCRGNTYASKDDHKQLFDA